MPVKVLKSFVGAIKVKVADIDFDKSLSAETADSGDLGGYARAFRGAGRGGAGV